MGGAADLVYVGGETPPRASLLACEDASPAMLHLLVCRQRSSHERLAVRVGAPEVGGVGEERRRVAVPNERATRCHRRIRDGLAGEQVGSR